MSELKPCPFCGEMPAVSISGCECKGKTVHVSCEGDEHHCPTISAGSHEQAYQLWNTRPTDDRLRRERNEARGEITALDQGIRDLLSELNTLRAAAAVQDERLVEIAKLDYACAAVNGCAHRAVELARAALSASPGAGESVESKVDGEAYGVCPCPACGVDFKWRLHGETGDWHLDMTYTEPEASIEVGLPVSPTGLLRHYLARALDHIAGDDQMDDVETERAFDVLDRSPEVIAVVEGWWCLECDSEIHGLDPDAIPPSDRYFSCACGGNICKITKTITARDVGDQHPVSPDTKLSRDVEGEDDDGCV